MKKNHRRLLAWLCALMMLAAMLPAYAVGAAAYNEHDAEMLRTFFAYVSTLQVSNGVAINGADYTPNDPASWVGCTWNSAGRLTAVDFSYSSAVGNLDLSDCAALTDLNCINNHLTFFI